MDACKFQNESEKERSKMVEILNPLVPLTNEIELLLKRKGKSDSEVRLYKSIWYYLDPQESDREKEFLLYKDDPILENMFKKLHEIAQKIIQEKSSIVQESKQKIREYEKIGKSLPCIKII